MTPEQVALSAQLSARFDALKDDFARLDAEAEAKIVRWRYADGSAFELQVEYFRRFNEKPGKLVDEEPVQAYLYCAYGYDVEGQIVATYVFHSEDLPRSCVFYEYNAEHIYFTEYARISHFYENFELSKVGHRINEQGRPVQYAAFDNLAGDSNLTIETYLYDAQGLLEKIITVYSGNRWLPVVRHEKTLFTYKDGKLLEIRSTFEHEQNETPHILYQAPFKRNELGIVADYARASLRETIVDVVRRESERLRQNQVFAMEIYHDAVAGDACSISFEYEHERIRWRLNNPDGDYNDFRNYSFDTLPVRRGEDAFLHVEWPQDATRYIKQMQKEHRFKDIRRLYMNVARDLNQRNWRDLLNVTHDFFVFAQDFLSMQDHPATDDIRACLPKYKIALLQAQGLL